MNNRNEEGIHWLMGWVTIWMQNKSGSMFPGVVGGLE